MFTPESKILYPKTGHTRQDLLDYYKEVSSVFLPFVKEKAVSLVRAPHGVGDIQFYQRHPSENFPKYIDRVKIKENEGKGVYILIDSYEDIEYLVTIGTIEFHQWHANAHTPELPVAMLFDLDPGPEITVDRMREAASILHERLDWQGLPNFVKTSGIQGFHIIVPLHTKTTWEIVRSDAKALADELSQKYPHLFTAVAKKTERKEKIFIDYLRNARGATNAAPFTARSFERPTISVPFAWSELNDVAPDSWTVDDIKQKGFLARAKLWV